ncbi:MAG: HPr family phosphocarrier protein [Spirochaetes bacterium]|jgi:phosphocarrier protein HPr|nr:HPr family phosphocarrier protein [Spirochaetota bacterium]
MVEKKVVIPGDSGIHARPATMLVKMATKFNCNVFIEKDGTDANLKSILNILALGLTGGTEIKIKADGVGENEAVDEIVALIERDFAD